MVGNRMFLLETVKTTVYEGLDIPHMSYDLIFGGMSVAVPAMGRREELQSGISSCIGLRTWNFHHYHFTSRDDWGVIYCSPCRMDFGNCRWLLLGCLAHEHPGCNHWNGDFLNSLLIWGGHICR
jgi:hypothetical protein